MIDIFFLKSLNPIFEISIPSISIFPFDTEQELMTIQKRKLIQ